MPKEVNLTIDNCPVTVPEGTLVVDAARKAGINIPVFCYHPKLDPVGMCRMCLVEIGVPMVDRATRAPVLDENGLQKIQFLPKLETGCTMRVSEGMIVRGYTQKVIYARDEILEFLLTSHPLDCPVCDKGGECPLQNLTMAHGPGTSRFLYDDKIHLAKQLPLGPLIYLDRERCIQCARCTRFQSEIVADPVIGFYNRGRRLEIVSYSEPGFASYFSGNTTDICPVGALTTADFRFGARPWELDAAASLCAHCPVGCNITYNIRREAKSGGEIVIKRAMPRQNEAVNEIWMCDKGRFAYHYTGDRARLTEPLLRKNGELVPATWEEALDHTAGQLRAAGRSLATLATGRLANEDLFNLHELTAHQGGRLVLHTHMAGGDLTAQVGVGAGTNLAGLGKGDAILVVACDLEEEAPIWWLRVKQAAERGVTLIVANPRRTKTARYAAHTLRYRYGEEAAAVTGLLAGESEAAKAFAAANNAILFYGSEGTGLETSQALAQACTNLLLHTGHVGRANNGLVAVWPRANDQGAWDMGFRPAADLAAALHGANALYLAAADPVGDDPALGEAIDAADFVVVEELFLTETAKRADVVLPAQAYTEREGSFTSGERRVQRFYLVVPPRGQTRADYTITAQIALRLGKQLEGRYPSRVMAQIAAAVPAYAGVTYAGLAHVEPQWPEVARSDLYYGGTTYENSQGLGIQLASAAERGESLRPGNVVAPAKPGGAGLLAVPVTRLYDRGITVRTSEVLVPRLERPHVVLHPVDAANAGIAAGASIEITLDGVAYPVEARLDETSQPGVVLVPRSLGVPVSGPVGVRVYRD